MKTKVLFICTHNAFRSQMAEGFARALFGDRVEALSAGINPAGLSELAVQVMAEMGIDISDQRSKSIDEILSQHPASEFDLVVTVCSSAREMCPTLPGAKRVIHREIRDMGYGDKTYASPLEEAREIRDNVKQMVIEVVSELVGRV